MAARHIRRVLNRFVRLARCVAGLTFAMTLFAFAPASDSRRVEDLTTSARVTGDLSPNIVARLGTARYVLSGKSTVFSHDGTRLAVLSYYTVHVLDVATGSELFAVRINPTNVSGSPGMGLRFTRAGGLVAFW